MKEFAAEYHRELNRLNAARDDHHIRQKEELDGVDRQIPRGHRRDQGGLRTPGMKDELFALEARKETLVAGITHAPPPAPQLHPKLADLYRQRVKRLQQELNRPELRIEAFEALRALIDEVHLVPEKGRLEIELVDDLASILALGADGKKKPVPENRDGLQVTLVAGAGSGLCDIFNAKG